MEKDVYSINLDIKMTVSKIDSNKKENNETKPITNNKLNDVDKYLSFRDSPRLYTVKEVAEILKVNPNRVYELIKKGCLIGLKLGSLKVTNLELVRFFKNTKEKI